MITLKYNKKTPAVYISHIDTLRGMIRTMRRADVNVRFSLGFNPHMLLFFSPPLALGVSSEAEYMTVECEDIPTADFVEKYNLSAPAGFEGIEAFETAKNPNLAGIITAADYTLKCGNCEGAKQTVEAILKAETYEINFSQKGEKETKKIRKQIYGISLDGSVITVRLATGNSNLRADRIAAQFNADFNTQIKTASILKIKQFVARENGFEEVDEFLKRQVKTL